MADIDFSDPRIKTISQLEGILSPYESAHLMGTISGSIKGGELLQSDSIEFFASPSFDVDDVITTSSARMFISSSVDEDDRGAFLLGTIKINNDKSDNEDASYSKDVELILNIALSSPVNSAPTEVKIPLRIYSTGEPDSSPVITFLETSLRQEVSIKLDGQSETPIYLGIGNLSYESVSSGDSEEIKVFGKFVVERDAIVKNAVRVYPNQSISDPDLYVPGAVGNSAKGTIEAYFTPNFGLTLKQAAELSGFQEFNWYQKITYSDEVAFEFPWTDPPANATIAPGKNGFRKWTDIYPYYLNIGTTPDPSKIPAGVENNPALWLENQITSNGKSLRLIDTPEIAKYFPSLAKTHFETYLVGINKRYPGLSTALNKFSWKTNRTSSELLADLGFSPDITEVATKGGIIELIENLPVTDLLPGYFYAKDILIDNSGTVTLTSNGLNAFNSNLLPEPTITSLKSIILDETTENLILEGDANINGIGNSLNNVILGNPGKNTLNGRNGNDALLGEAGDDLLGGEAGDDLLNGGKGKDILIGGKGADHFIFAGTSSVLALKTSTLQHLDRVTDFNPREGDRFRIDFDNTGSTIESPSKIFYAGKFKGKLKTVAQLVYTDKSSKRKGRQSLGVNQAVLFRVKKQTFLSVNDNNKKFSFQNDFLVNITGSVIQDDGKISEVLRVKHYFV